MFAARFSTADQNPDHQIDALVRTGSENLSLFGGNPNNKWAFIERKYLPKTVGARGLCDNSSTVSRHPLETEFDAGPQVARNQAERTGREDWSLVCANQVQRP